MANKENSSEYKDPTIAEVADLMAIQICKESGYDAPDLIARPLRILGEAMNQQVDGSMRWQRDGLLVNDDGGVISTHKFLTGIMNSGEFANMKVEFTSNNLGPFARPTNKFSLLSQVIKELGAYEAGYLMSFPNFDVVNTKVLWEEIGIDTPVYVVDNPAEIFNRFTVNIQRDPNLPRPSCEPPRVIVTNNYRNVGHHFGMQIQVPDTSGEYKNIFDLLIGKSPSDLADARALVQEVNKQPISYVADPMMDVAIECANIAGKKGFYPYGAVFRRFDGPLTIARNDTKRDIDLRGHAETLALQQVGDMTRGILYTTAAPCHGCTQSWMGSSVAGINYGMIQGVDYHAVDMSLAKKGNKEGHGVDFVWNFNMAPKVIDMLRQHNGGDDFREMIKLNEYWLERRRVEEERLSLVEGRQVVLNHDWMSSVRHIMA